VPRRPDHDPARLLAGCPASESARGAGRVLGVAAAGVATHEASDVVHLEGLRDVLRRAEAASEESLPFAGSGREDDHGGPPDGDVLELAKEGPSVPSRHHEIQDHDGRRLRADQIEPVHRTASGADVVALRLQADGQDLADVRLIVYNENLRAHEGSIGTKRARLKAEYDVVATPARPFGRARMSDRKNHCSSEYSSGSPESRRGTMHALLVTAHVEPGREENDREKGLEYLRMNVLPQLKQLPGLLSGYWLATTKDGESLAVVLFENEGAAQEMATIGLPNAPQPPGATLGAIEVREVVAHI
jgi:hypothetical protein